MIPIDVDGGLIDQRLGVRLGLSAGQCGQLPEFQDVPELTLRQLHLDVLQGWGAGKRRQGFHKILIGTDFPQRDGIRNSAKQDNDVKVRNQVLFVGRHAVGFSV